MAVIEISGNQYELEVTEKALDSIEEALGGSLLHTLQSQRGMLSVKHLKVITSYALKNFEGGRIPPIKGMEIAADWIREVGYTEVSKIVLEQIQKDLPFLFHTD